MHHGWSIVGLTFGTQFVANALGFYAFGVLLGPIAEDFGASRASVGLIPFALSWAGALLGPIIGRLVTFVPIHLIMTVGTTAMGLGFFAMSRADAIWQLQLGYACTISLGLNTLTGVTASALIVNWFEARRAFALGLAGVGISLAGFLMTPVTSYWVASYGWRTTFEIFGVIALAVAPIVFLFATTHPRDRGELPYGASGSSDADADAGNVDAADAAASNGPALPFSTRAALANPALWLIAMAGGVSFMASTGMITHAVSYGTDAGFDPVDAAFLLTAAAGAAAVAKLLFGWLAERVGERAAFGLVLGCQALGLIGVIEARASYPALLALMAVFGLGMGGAVPLMNALLARVFGVSHFGPVMGLAGPILVLFQSVGAPFLGWIYDTRGNYELGLWIMVGILALPMFGIFLLRVPENEPA